MSFGAVAGQPDVALVIDRDAVIAVGPVVALCPDRPTISRGSRPGRRRAPAGATLQHMPIIAPGAG